MSKLGDKERKKLRRTAFELHLQDDQLIAVGHVATNAWWRTQSPSSRFQTKFMKQTRVLRTNSQINGTGNFYQVAGKAFAGCRELPGHFVN
jgi:hypothetical protein